MDNTRENKNKFLGMHLGGLCLVDVPDLDVNVKQLAQIDGDLISEKGLEYFTNVEVLLKPLSMLTDEHWVRNWKRAPLITDKSTNTF